MSADNGIYILETLAPNKNGNEYRVAHAQAINEIYWSDTAGGYNAEPAEQIINARIIFDNAPVFSSQEKADNYAILLSKDYNFLENGISFISIDQIF